jgi:ABC-2 type transport system ATP-binding protein
LPPSEPPVISARGLAKSYGRVRALNGIDLEVARGTVLALLGPNGAGKTTAVRILSTLLRPDAGQVSIGGYDALREPRKVQGLIGLAGQSASVDTRLTGTENLVMLGRLGRLGRRDAIGRARQLTEQFGLTAEAGRPVRSYSGGMRRKLDLAASLITAPPILFLDEPTTGLDPLSRNTLWATIRELAQGGTTVLLTTQYLEEADHLADEVAVIDGGRMIARSTAADLKASADGSRFEVVASTDTDFRRLASLLPDRMAASEPGTRLVSFAADEGGRDGLRALGQLATSIVAADIAVDSYSVHQPTLDDAFLQLITHVTSGTSTPEN